MDRRRFLQGLGCAGASIPGLWPMEVNGVPAGPPGPAEEVLAGIDCWIPHTCPDGWMSPGQQTTLLDAKPHEVDIVRVTFADVEEAFCKHWQGARHAARHFRPDLLLLNFNPARPRQYTDLLDQARQHRHAGSPVLAIVRRKGLMGRDALRSDLTCRRLLQAGVPVLASRSEHDLAGVLLDLVGATHDQSFDWGGVQYMLRDGPLMAFARGHADSPGSVADAVESCAAQLRAAGLDRHQIRRAQVTVYGDLDFEGFYSVVQTCQKLRGCEGTTDLMVKWNQWVWKEPGITLHVLAAGFAADLVARRADG